jgi:hypothetical protein
MMPPIGKPRLAMKQTEPLFINRVSFNSLKRLVERGSGPLYLIMGWYGEFLTDHGLAEIYYPNGPNRLPQARATELGAKIVGEWRANGEKFVRRPAA